VTQGLIIGGMSKTFGNTHALRHVDLAIAAGRIHGLVGENGAGKSTLIKIISGVYTADEGEMVLAGAPFRPGSPAAAQQSGVVVVPQELRIVPGMTAAENLFLGDWPTRRLAGVLPVIDRAALRRNMGEAMKRTGLDIAPDTPMRALSFAQRQMLVIARALGRKASVLILDEPTASLGQDDAERLFALLRRLRDQGVAIVFVSHRLEEIQDLSDEVTVLRDGAVAAEYTAGDYGISDLIAAMTGRELARKGSLSKRAPGKDIAETLTDGMIGQSPFALHQGQAAGLAGLLGAGGDTLLRRLFGAGRSASQAIRFRSPAAAIGAGVGYVPSERRLGILSRLSVAENIILPHLSRRDVPTRTQIAKVMSLLDIRPADPDLAAGTLSGGNQQKVLFARWLVSNCRVLLLDEPTHGVDVAAKAQIHKLIGEYLDNGGAAMINSAEFAELMTLCDEIHAMREGAIVARFDKDSPDYTEHALRRVLAG